MYYFLLIHVPTARIIFILFHEQAVCKRDQNRKMVGKISMYIYHSLTGVRDKSIVQRPTVKRL